MRLAFLLHEYFPHGGLQRNFHCLLEELTERGHLCRVYCASWGGGQLDGVDLRRVRTAALGRHRRHQRFVQQVESDLAREPVDAVIGFNPMPGLNVYFAHEPCHQEVALCERGYFYRRSAAYRHFAAMERAVFDPASTTDILLTSESQRDVYQQHYQTQARRMHLLPPGVALDRRAPEDASARRKTLRATLGLELQELALLFVGNGFHAKGLDRAITALANISAAQPSEKFRLLVVGQEKYRSFERLARRLGVAAKVVFLGGRDDIPDLLQAADLLIHPAVRDTSGIVPLEAIAAGLPVVATDVCGAASHVRAARAGILLPTPFSQEQLERAVMRNIDGVFRAECRRSALQYARLTDLYSMHRLGADLIEHLLEQTQ